MTEDFSISPQTLIWNIHLQIERTTNMHAFTYIDICIHVHICIYMYIHAYLQQVYVYRYIHMSYTICTYLFYIYIYMLILCTPNNLSGTRSYINDLCPLLASATASGRGSGAGASGTEASPATSLGELTGLGPQRPQKQRDPNIVYIVLHGIDMV